MTGLKVNEMSSKQVAKAVRAVPTDRHFEWDGQDENERPLKPGEMRAGMAAARKRGLPAGSGSTTESLEPRMDGRGVAR